jgi:hypothetical protein
LVAEPMNPTRRAASRLALWEPGTRGVSGERAGAPVGFGEQTRGFAGRTRGMTGVVGPGCVLRSGPGPKDSGPRVGACSELDEAGPGVLVLSRVIAGAGQLSEAGPVRVVKVKQLGGPVHRER